MFSISYVPFEFKLRFKNEIDLRKNPPLPFILRSVLGKNLRAMSCIAKSSNCIDCIYNKTCAYSYIFETIIEQENNLNPGTNRASHPFVFSNYTYNNIEKKSDVYDEASFVITLFGASIKFLPYVYAAFLRAEQSGLFKERVPFEITDVLIKDNSQKDSILVDKNNINMEFPIFTWKSTEDKTKLQNKEILVELKTPLRFKVNGKYTKDFTAQDFFNCLYRRMKTCCFLYGIFDENKKYIPNKDIKIIERKLFWKDKTHYSSRQKNTMELGGVIGTFKIQGYFSEFDLSLLDFAQRFNAGKNTNFGLGILDYWEKNI